MVIDAGAADAVPLERFAILAPRAVLAGGPDNATTALVRERLLKAGFTTVSVLAEPPVGSEKDAARAAA